MGWPMSSLAHKAQSRTAGSRRRSVRLFAYQAFHEAYDLARAGGTLEAADRAAIAEQAADQALAQHVKDAANALPAVESVPEVVGAAVLAERIRDAVVATQTADPAGVLSRAATASDTTETESDVSETW